MRTLVPSRVFGVLVLAAMILIAALAVALALAAVLAQMADDVAARVLLWIALGLGAILAIDLVGLLLALGINAATPGANAPGSREPRASALGVGDEPLEE